MHKIYVCVCVCTGIGVSKLIDFIVVVCIYNIIIRTIFAFSTLRHGFTSFNGRETRGKSFRRRVLSSDLINVKRTF